MDKLEKEKQQIIFERYREGKTRAEIAKEIGCADSTVSKYLVACGYRKYIRKDDWSIDNVVYDTPEQIACCCNCPLPECRAMTKICPLNKIK